MARVHTVKKAQKDYPEFGIKKGDTYYWWKFRFGTVHKSKTFPTRQQLTQSPFYQQLYDIEDQLSSFSASDPDELQSGRDDIIDQINQLRDECQDSLDNMPEHLQETSDSGMMLQEQIDALDEWASELEGIDTDIGEEDFEESSDTEEEQEEKRQARIDEIATEIQDMAGNHNVP